MRFMPVPTSGLHVVSTVITVNERGENGTWVPRGITMTEQGIKIRLSGNRIAVSPVIAIILMVAITIVLAGVLWLWVATLIDTPKDIDVGDGVMVEFTGMNKNNDYVYRVKKVPSKETMTVTNIRFELLDRNKVDRSNGQHNLENIYGKPIDDRTFISFRDGDHDGLITIGDRILIKGADHIDDDGSGDSPGYAEGGYTFILKYRSKLVLEEVI